VAQADVWTPAQTHKAITVADAHWPTSPCAHRETISWVQSVSMADFAATAYPTQCAVTVAWNQVAAANPSPGYMCTILEHEFGHLAGLGHSPDSDNVMYAVVWKIAPDCAAAFPKHAKLPEAGLPAKAARSTKPVRVASAARRAK
jgi:hypothetical protein